MDTLIGGAGSDRFILGSGAGTDTITDYQDNIDQLVLVGGLELEQLSFVLNGNNTEIKVVATKEILAIVNNVNPDVFDLTDFTS